MPLSIGVLGVAPVLLTGSAVLGKLLPLWIALLLSTGWLNRGSRHALLADLPGWALAVPLAATVLASLWGRVQPFRITPKHREQGRGGIAPVLALPLLLLLALNGLNLAWILHHLAAGGSPGGWLGLLWAGLTLLGLLVALRACSDPPAGDPAPWLALELEGQLLGRDPSGRPIRLAVAITALSERGAMVGARAPRSLSALAEGCRLERLQIQAPGTALPPLPVQAKARDGQLGWAWPTEACGEREAFLHWLYGRPGAWPQRQAPPEWRALLALLRRLFSSGRAQRAARLSLVPQQLGAQPAPGTHAG